METVAVKRCYIKVAPEGNTKSCHVNIALHVSYLGAHPELTYTVLDPTEFHNRKKRWSTTVSLKYNNYSTSNN